MRPASAAPRARPARSASTAPAERGQHVRARGSDVQAGELALAAGTVLGPPQIGLLAAIGRGTVRVRPRPRVVVLSTGSELVQPGEALGPGQIYDSNSFALAAAARDAGAIAYRVGAVADDAETLRATIEDQLIRADLLVTTGGVSVGAYDVVKEALSCRRLVRARTAPRGRLPQARHAAGQAAGLRHHRPRPHAAAGPARQPGLLLRLLRALRPPRDPRPDGPREVHRPSVRAECSEALRPRCPGGRRQFLRGNYDAEAARSARSADRAPT